jgi:heparinase II/III-like protein
MHGDYIANHLELGDVNGNHYLCDAVGLVFLGAFFRATPNGRRWLEMGRAIVEAEIFNQTSEDGVDFEKSTAYHRLVLEAFLTSYLLLRLHGDAPPAAWVERLQRMLEFVEAYTKPDGAIPLIGDADDGRIQKLGRQGINDHRYLLSAGAALFERGDFKRAARCFADEAFWLLGPAAADRFDALQVPTQPAASRAFHAGGFYVLRTSRAHVIVDCGDVGMHGRGGHGHSDITSLEVWLDGVNLVSDCGAYLYTASREWRNRFRSTAFHNVVQIEDEELNRLISPDHLWQLRDDARPRDVAWRLEEHADYFRGGHDAYARLTPPVVITREVLLLKDTADILIRDRVETDRDGASQAARRRVSSRFHLDPAVTARVEDSDVRLSARGRDMWLQVVDPIGGIDIHDGWVSPSYGVRTRTSTISIEQEVALPITMTYRIGIQRLDRARLRDVASGLNQCVNC